MPSRIIRCSCGAIINERRAKTVNGKTLCPNCASIAEKYKKRMTRRAEDYHVVVFLLDGTVQMFNPMEART
jgi:hypothetical protein